MSDFKKLVALLSKFGVTHDVSNPHKNMRKFVSIDARVGNVVGHPACSCTFQFSPEGKFVEVGVWG